MNRNVVAVLVCIVVSGVYLFFNSSMFIADSLGWEGNYYLSADELDILLDFEPTNVMRIDGNAITTKLQEHPWVDSALMRWRWPNEIMIEVQERKPLALVPVQESWYLLDREGNLLPPPLGINMYTLPLVTNVDTESVEQLRSTARVLGHIPERLWNSISEWNGQSRTLVSRDGTQILIGESQDLDLKLEIMELIFDDLASQNKHARRIDLRVPTSPVVTLR